MPSADSSSFGMRVPTSGFMKEVTPSKPKSAASGWGNMFAMKAGEWKCPGFYAKNDKNVLKCPCCETEKPNSSSSKGEKIEDKYNGKDGNPCSTNRTTVKVGDTTNTNGINDESDELAIQMKLDFENEIAIKTIAT